MSAVFLRSAFNYSDYGRNRVMMEAMSHLFYLHGATFAEAKDAMAFALQTKEGK